MKPKKILSLLLALSLLAGCSSSSNENTTQESAAESTEDTTAEQSTEETKEEAKEEPEEETTEEPQPIGTAITTNDVTYTLESVDYSEGTNQFAMPEEGNNFVHCLVKIENGTDEDLDYNPYYGWKMLSPTGAYEGASITASTDIENALQSGTLAPGGYIEGVISFEEPVEGKLVLVAYTGPFSKEKAAQWLVRE